MNMAASIITAVNIPAKKKVQKTLPRGDRWVVVVVVDFGESL